MPSGALVTNSAIAVILVVIAITLLSLRTVADWYVRSEMGGYVIAVWIAGLLIVGAVWKRHPKIAEKAGMALFAAFVIHLILHVSAG